jgi:uncharacterized membrane protein
MQENMMLKKISLAAALATTFITGSAAVANAESGVGIGGPDSMTDSAALENDYARRGGYAYSYAPAGRYAYGYVPEGRIVRSHKRDRNN